MDDDSTTANADNQTDANNANQSDPNKTATDSGTATDKTGGDNSDETSKSTDNSAGGDKSTTDEDDKSSAPKFDTDLDEWAVKTKRPAPTTDRERELYQEIRNSQREFSRSKQSKDDAVKAVDKAIDTAKPADNKTDDDDDDRDPVEKRQDAIEAQLQEERSTRLRGEYFAEKSVTADESKLMGEILQEKVDKAKTPQAKKAAFDYWTHPDQLEDWHALAKARLSTTKDTSVIEEEAARKERERIAKESNAGTTGRNANNGQQKTKTGYDRNAFLKSDD